MKVSKLIFLFLMGIMLGKAQTKKQMNDQTIYQFEVEDITGKAFSLSSLQGKKVMIVNTASKCGLTPQYKELEALYQQYKDKDFVIIGFPANNFLKQEPGTNEEIATFCQVNYGVSFPMMSKISVKGKDMHPLYQFLTQKSKWRSRLQSKLELPKIPHRKGRTLRESNSTKNPTERP